MTDEFPSPEAIRAIEEAVERQREIDIAEAGPKALHGAIVYRGVSIDSRWKVLDEFNCLKSIVDELPDLVRARIQSVWIDSSCTSNYVVAVKPFRFIELIPEALETAIFRVCGGHNGVRIDGDFPGAEIYLDCNWGELAGSD